MPLGPVDRERSLREGAAHPLHLLRCGTVLPPVGGRVGAVCTRLGPAWVRLVLEPTLAVGVVMNIVTPAEPAVRGAGRAEDEDVTWLRLVCARLVRGKGRG